MAEYYLNLLAVWLQQISNPKYTDIAIEAESGYWTDEPIAMVPVQGIRPIDQL